jgi:hypothetical protein
MFIPAVYAVVLRMIVLSSSQACGQAADPKTGGPRYFRRGRSRIRTAAVAINGIVAAAKKAG